MRLIRPIKSFLLNGIQINTNRTEETPKRNSTTSARLMRFFLIKTEELIMMILPMAPTPMKMLIRPLKGSFNNLVHKTRTKRNSLINTTLKEKEITMKFSECQEDQLWMILIELIVN